MIQVSRLSKQYGPRAAVQDLSFEVKKGEVVGFLGPNGAGKSTTMKMITGFTAMTSGSVQVEGHDVFEAPLEVKRRIGFLPENPPVYSEMTVTDYLRFAAQIHLVPAAQLETQVRWAIEKTILGDVRHRVIGNLSKGYRQRVGLAQALVHNPPVLILDEPTVGLDPKQIIEIRELIKTLQGEHTVILSTHILPEVTATCQRVIVINQGKIVAQDTLDELTQRLHQGTTYTLEVKKVDAVGLEDIRKIPGVAQVETQGTSKIVVKAASHSGEIRERIVEIAIQRGMGLLEFNADKVSLEEVFLKLTAEKGE